MTELFDAMHKFFAKLGIPVYPENSVPSDAVFPYLTWTPVQIPWYSDSIMYARIWDRSENFTDLAELADKFGGMIDSTTIPAGKGYIYLAKGTPWCQAEALPGSDIKYMYFNIVIHTIF